MITNTLKAALVCLVVALPAFAAEPTGSNANDSCTPVRPCLPPEVYLQMLKQQTELISIHQTEKEKLTTQREISATLTRFSPPSWPNAKET